MRGPKGGSLTKDEADKGVIWRYEVSRATAVSVDTNLVNQFVGFAGLGLLTAAARSLI